MSKPRIPLIRPPLHFNKVEADLKKVIESGMLTRGEYVERFRTEIAKTTTATYSHLATSATTALSTCLRLLGVGPGDEVALADFSFPATSNVVEEVGAKPIFVDVSPDTYNMMPDALSKALSEKTKAVIFVSTFGNPSGIHAILNICRAKKIPLIEDAACALGSSENGIPSGKIADLSCFSFHPRKIITTGEGGAITTENPEWSEKLKRMLNHGAVIENGKWKFTDVGTNLRLTEIQAVLGLDQLRRLSSIIDARNAIREKYIHALAPLGFRPQKIDPKCVSNTQSVVFRMPQGKSRDALIAHLAKSGIESTLGTYCLSGTAYNRAHYGKVEPTSEILERETITLPCFEGMPINEVLREIQSFL